jgi:hypothetical protein
MDSENKTMVDSELTDNTNYENTTSKGKIQLVGDLNGPPMRMVDIEGKCIYKYQLKPEKNCTKKKDKDK